MDVDVDVDVCIWARDRMHVDTDIVQCIACG